MSDPVESPGAAPPAPIANLLHDRLSTLDEAEDDLVVEELVRALTGRETVAESVYSVVDDLPVRPRVRNECVTTPHLDAATSKPASGCLIGIIRRSAFHARYYWLLLAESHLTRRPFGAMLRRIWPLRVPTLTGRRPTI